MYRKFKPLNIPDGWEQYWSKYPNGYTIMEALIDWVSQVDDMVKNQNELTDTVKSFGERIDEFINQFGAELQREVQDLLTEWQNSGFLNIVISEALQWELDNFKSTTEQNFLSVDEQFQETQDDINQRGIDIKTFGAIGDGVTDDTIAIQSALDTCKKIFWSNGDYYFKKVFITKDNTTIQFGEKVKLLSDYGGDTLLEGAISIEGVEGEELFPLANDVESGANTVRIYSPNSFSKDDFVILTQTNPTGNTLEIHRQKYLFSVQTVKSVDINTGLITFNEDIPHSFQILNNATMRKLTPVKNVTLKGNATLFDKMGTTEYASHIYIAGAYNVNIEGFDFTNGGGKGITIYKSYRFHFKNMTYKDPTNVEAGHGYGFQISTGSCFGTISKAMVYHSRHGFDLTTGANHCLIEDCTGFASNFNGHGTNSKYIDFVNCTAYDCNFSVGNYAFLSDENYRFVNCKVYQDSRAVDDTLVGFHVAAESFNVEIIDCYSNARKGIQILYDVKNVRIDNTVVENATSGIELLTGGKVRISNSTISNSGNIGIDIRQNANDIAISNTEINTKAGSTFGIRILASNNVRINNVLITGETGSSINVSNDAERVYIENSKILGTALRSIHHHVNTKFIKITNNEIANNLVVSIGSAVITNNYLTGSNVLITEATPQGNVLFFKDNYGRATNVTLPEESATIKIDGNTFL